jgi:2-dehydro-3-deoxyphosphogluconate aldolase/(4S)-4-hydroxy-2-oxoglutarate aldolase
MPDASRIVELITAGGICAILRVPSPDDLVPVAQAILDGGINAIEVAVTTPGVLRALEPTRAKLGRDVLVGVGTVFTADEAREAIRVGAQFLAAPNFNPDVLRVGLERGVAIMAGALTPTEIIRAWDAGANLVRLFPAAPAGPAYVRDLQGSLPYIPLIPSGGITLDSVTDFIRAGAAAVGVGDALASRELVARRDFREITARAREFVEAVARARGRTERPVPAVKPIEGPDTR